MRRILRGCANGACVLGLCAWAAAQPVWPAHQMTTAETLGYGADARLLLIQAEDLGMAHSIDKASFEALEKGWVTTAGILVPAPWFPEVVRLFHIHPTVDVGIQLDLNSEWLSYRWRSVSIQPAASDLLDPSGYLPKNAQYIGRHAKPEEVASEFRAQLDGAKKAGIPISHLDSHGGIVLYTPWLFKEYWKASAESGLAAILSKEYVFQRGKPTQKLNIYEVGDVEVDITTLPIDRIITMEPGFAQKEWLSAYERTLGALPPGVYLLSVHLGYNDEELQAMTVDHPNWGAQWRQNDLDVVSNPEFQKFLKDKGFILVGWKDLQKAMPAQHHQPN
jgi:chitin disaccharide deacetylase